MLINITFLFIKILIFSDARTIKFPEFDDKFSFSVVVLKLLSELNFKLLDYYPLE